MLRLERDIMTSLFTKLGFEIEFYGIDFNGLMDRLSKYSPKQQDVNFPVLLKSEDRFFNRTMVFRNIKMNILVLGELTIKPETISIDLFEKLSDSSPLRWELVTEPLETVEQIFLLEEFLKDLVAEDYLSNPLCSIQVNSEIEKDEILPVVSCYYTHYFKECQRSEYLSYPTQSRALELIQECKGEGIYRMFQVFIIDAFKNLQESDESIEDFIDREGFRETNNLSKVIKFNHLKVSSALMYYCKQEGFHLETIRAIESLQTVWTIPALEFREFHNNWDLQYCIRKVRNVYQK